MPEQPDLSMVTSTELVKELRSRCQCIVIGYMLDAEPGHWRTFVGGPRLMVAGMGVELSVLVRKYLAGALNLDPEDSP